MLQIGKSLGVYFYYKSLLQPRNGNTVLYLNNKDNYIVLFFP